MKTAIITKVTKMNSDLKTSGPHKIGSFDKGIIYSMFYNQHALTIEVDGKNDTYSKRMKITEVVKDHFKK